MALALLTACEHSGETSPEVPTAVSAAPAQNERAEPGAPARPTLRPESLDAMAWVGAFSLDARGPRVPEPPTHDADGALWWSFPCSVGETSRGEVIALGYTYQDFGATGLCNTRLVEHGEGQRLELGRRPDTSTTTWRWSPLAEDVATRELPVGFAEGILITKDHEGATLRGRDPGGRVAWERALEGRLLQLRWGEDGVLTAQMLRRVGEDVTLVRVALEPRGGAVLGERELDPTLRALMNDPASYIERFVREARERADGEYAKTDRFQVGGLRVVTSEESFPYLIHSVEDAESGEERWSESVNAGKTLGVIRAGVVGSTLVVARLTGALYTAGGQPREPAEVLEAMPRFEVLVHDLKTGRLHATWSYENTTNVAPAGALDGAREKIDDLE